PSTPCRTLEPRYGSRAPDLQQIGSVDEGAKAEEIGNGAGSNVTPMGAVLREVIIDCNAPRRVAQFWGEVLGWEVQQSDHVFWMSESGAPFPDLLLVFVPVP